MVRAKCAARLQQQRRLADPGLAADEDERAGDDTAAEHAIELADAGRTAARRRQVDVGIELRPGGPGKRVALLGRAGRHRRGHGTLLDHRVPGAALGTAAQPLGRLRAALLTGEDGLGFH